VADDVALRGQLGGDLDAGLAPEADDIADVLADLVRIDVDRRDELDPRFGEQDCTVAKCSPILGGAYSQSEQLRSSIEESGEVTHRTTMCANPRIVKRRSSDVNRRFHSLRKPAKKPTS